MIYEYFFDSYDWLLLGGHVLLVVLTIVAARLYWLAFKGVPRRKCRKLFATERYDNAVAAVRTLRAGCLVGSSAPDEPSVEKISMDFLRRSQDELRWSLGRSLRAAAWIKVLRNGLGILTCANLVCAALQGLRGLSVEKVSPPWVYHEAVTSLVLQVVWALPFFIAVWVLEASSRIVLVDYQYQLDRLGLQLTNRQSGEDDR